MGHARQHDCGDALTTRRSADVEVPDAPVSPMPLPAAPVTSGIAPAAVADQPSGAPALLGLQPAVDDGVGLPLRRLHAGRPPGQLSPDPAAPPAETDPASPGLDGLANALRTVEALVTGLHTGISAQLTPEVADALADRLQQSSTLSALFPQVFLAGTVVGIVEDAVDAVSGVIDAVEMILNIDELIEQATEILEIVVSPEGGELGRVLGEEIGRGWGQQLVDLSTKGVFEFTYELGKIAGPAIVYTIVSFVGLPAIAGAAVYARVSKALLPLMKRFPRLAKLAAQLAKRLPDHEPHLPNTPHAPATPRPGPAPERLGGDVDLLLEMPEGAATRPGRRKRPQPLTSNSRSEAARKEFDKLRPVYQDWLSVGPQGQVHHAIELQALDRYPDVFSPDDLNDFTNMRGIPGELAGKDLAAQTAALGERYAGKGPVPKPVDPDTYLSTEITGSKAQLHQSKIREVWDRAYVDLDAAIAQQVKDGAFEVGDAGYRTFVRSRLENARDMIDHLYGQFFSEGRAQHFGTKY